MSPKYIWKIVASYNSMVDAEVAAGRLDHVGIARRIDQRGGVGLFGPGHGGKSVRGIDLLVPADELSAAREALDLVDN
jgi:hypothetical protein